MAKALVVANWKMNPRTLTEAKRLLEVTRRSALASKRASVVVVPPVVFLRDLRASYKGKALSFGAQDVSSALEGAYTGEISLPQVKDAGASYCIVGHSERRAAGETDEHTRKKVAAALEMKLTPVLCVGERSRAHSGEYLDVVKEQLRVGFFDVPAGKVGKVIVAYEPVWAIGGEEAIRPRQMHEMAIFIRKTLVALHGEGAMSLKILYGGAVTEENAADMLKHGDVQGLLVGHVSVDTERFPALLRALPN